MQIMRQSKQIFSLNERISADRRSILNTLIKALSTLRFSDLVAFFLRQAKKLATFAVKFFEFLN